MNGQSLFEPPFRIGKNLLRIFRLQTDRVESDHKAESGSGLDDRKIVWTKPFVRQLIRISSVSSDIVIRCVNIRQIDIESDLFICRIGGEETDASFLIPSLFRISVSGADRFPVVPFRSDSSENRNKPLQQLRPLRFGRIIDFCKRGMPGISLYRGTRYVRKSEQPVERDPAVFNDSIGEIDRKTAP